MRCAPPLRAMRHLTARAASAADPLGQQAPADRPRCLAACRRRAACSAPGAQRQAGAHAAPLAPAASANDRLCAGSQRRAPAAVSTSAASTSVSASTGAKQAVAPSYVTPAARKALFQPAKEQASGGARPLLAPLLRSLLPVQRAGLLPGQLPGPPAAHHEPPPCHAAAHRGGGAGQRQHPLLAQRLAAHQRWVRAGAGACASPASLAAPAADRPARCWPQAAATTAACCTCSTATPW